MWRTERLGSIGDANVFIRGGAVVYGFAGHNRGDAMNLQEFGALKLGDKIENLAIGGNSQGEIVECTPSGVRVVWGNRHDRETRFFYSVIGTAWMSWSKPE